MELNLHGKRAVVTGASRGLGKAIAAQLAKEGMSLILVARDRAALEANAVEFAAAGAGSVHLVLADLTDAQAPRDVVSRALETLGGLDLLVNCAGATKRGDFQALTDDDWADGFALKFFGTVRLCRAFWPHLAKSKGSIVNIVGVGSRTPSADFSIGGSVNSALLNFTKALADLGDKTGVRVNAVNPGYFATDRLGHRIEKIVKERGIPASEAEAEIRSALGIQRFGRPEEVANLVAYLSSDLGAYFQGATIDLDGGATKGL